MSPAAGRTRILFLCTGNSCRSQMAEGWVRALQADAFFDGGAQVRIPDSCAVGIQEYTALG